MAGLERFHFVGWVLIKSYILWLPYDWVYQEQRSLEDGLGRWHLYSTSQMHFWSDIFDKTKKNKNKVEHVYQLTGSLWEAMPS